MRYGETGANLEIDLTRGNIEKVEIDPKIAELYLGGRVLQRRYYGKEFLLKRNNGNPEKSNSEEYSEEMGAYMDSVVDDRFYSEIDSKEFVQKAISSKKVFLLAIGFEKDAILYFREFLSFLSESDLKIIEDLIEQEKGHIRKLASMRHQMAE